MKIYGRTLTEAEENQLKALGIGRRTFSMRIKTGWSWDDALTIPKNQRMSWNIGLHELNYQQIQTAKRNKISYNTVMNRLERGWSIEEAITTLT